MENIEQKLSELKTALEAATEKRWKGLSVQRLKHWKEKKYLQWMNWKQVLKTLSNGRWKRWSDKKKSRGFGWADLKPAKKNTWNWYIFQRCFGRNNGAKKADIQGYTKNRQQVSLELKRLVTWVLETDNFRHRNFCGNTMIGGVGRKPLRNQHIRNVVNVQPIATDSAYVIRDNAGEGGPTAVSMAAAKPQSDRDYVKLIVPVIKVAHYFKIPEEMLADNAWLQNEITAIGLEELLAKKMTCC